MAGAADRQKLSNPLNRPQNQGFKYSHISSLTYSMGSFQGWFPEKRFWNFHPVNRGAFFAAKNAAKNRAIRSN
jgi:hypothetical protein